MRFGFVPNLISDFILKAKRRKILDIQYKMRSIKIAAHLIAHLSNLLLNKQ
jgi:hypothetical protein